LASHEWFGTMKILVFEDDRVDQLCPISLARPAYAISCGGSRLIDWLESLESPIFGTVRPHLREIQAMDFAAVSSGAPPSEDSCLLVNARLVPSRTAYQCLRALLKSGQTSVVRHNDQIAAALVTSDVELPPIPSSQKQLKECLQPLMERPAHDEQLPLLKYSHDVIRYNMEILNDNLEHRLSTADYREIKDGVFAASGARLGDYCVTDTSSGPIVLEQDARIGPYCYLSGPALVGQGAKLIEHAAIKDAVSVGHTAKIGGEVEASVIEPYTNKQHHGFLGHSYLGSWINLGAGTCNSDLKNTYGKVNMEYSGGRVATDMQFVGCIMGDYAKTAINTGIFTGKTIGVCSMLYGFITSNVPSFVNYARLFGQITELPPEVMIATQARMFRRRNVEQRPCDVQLIHDMYELTRDERLLGGEPLAF
jgi:glucose-1-phosphate thymidylyltransferase